MIIQTVRHRRWDGAGRPETEDGSTVVRPLFPAITPIVLAGRRITAAELGDRAVGALPGSWSRILAAMTIVLGCGRKVRKVQLDCL